MLSYLREVREIRQAQRYHFEVVADKVEFGLAQALSFVIGAGLAVFVAYIGLASVVAIATA